MDWVVFKIGKPKINFGMSTKLQNFYHIEKCEIKLQTSFSLHALSCTAIANNSTVIYNFSKTN